MPRTIDQGFNEFLTKLTPSESESDAAKCHRSSVEACLKTNFGLKRFFRTGSFGNATSISGHSDTDYFAAIPTDKLKRNSGTTLAEVRSALETRFPKTGVCVSCPAVVVPFGEDRSETVEVVPADLTGTNNGYDTFDIPDCACGWMPASPDAHNAYVRAVHQKLDNQVKPLIRFIKAWKYFRHVPVSSFYLELRVAKYCEGEEAILYRIDLKNVLKQLLDNELARLQDPTGISGYISPCKSDAHRADALSKLETAYERAKKASDAVGSDKIKDAFDWYGLLFAGEFPSYYL